MLSEKLTGMISTSSSSGELNLSDVRSFFYFGNEAESVSVVTGPPHHVVITGSENICDEIRRWEAFHGDRHWRIRLTNDVAEKIFRLVKNVESDRIAIITDELDLAKGADLEFEGILWDAKLEIVEFSSNSATAVEICNSISRKLKAHKLKFAVSLFIYEREPTPSKD